MVQPTERATPRSGCPIASSLDVIGDRWTLVIVRDLINGKTRFGEFLTSPEGITTNILSDRLRRMQTAGLIDARLYEQHPPRYRYVLTDKGRGLHLVLQDICTWANAWIPGTWIPPETFMRPSARRTRPSRGKPVTQDRDARS